jgi:hypothetical protein
MQFESVTKVGSASPKPTAIVTISKTNAAIEIPCITLLLKKSATTDMKSYQRLISVAVGDWRTSED